MNDSDNTFDGLGIAPQLIEHLDKLKFRTPTPIQRKAIPIGLEGKDMIGIAQTGTGKTLAFSVPIIQTLVNGKGRALVLVPTRELAIQANDTIHKIGPVFGLKSIVLIGGAPIFSQTKGLHKRPQIVVATPGRLKDHMQRRNIQLKEFSIVILDEADRMLDMGFAPQVKEIMKATAPNRQIMLFSATMAKEVLSLATSHMKMPIRVEMAPAGSATENVTQELFIVNPDKKKFLLRSLLEKYRGSILLFARTKVGTKRLARDVRSMGHGAAEIHSDRTLGQRREALAGFKSGKYRVMVATDIAARGIDVVGIEVVINYDLPDDSENYVHRIGRTGRAGHKGHAITIATPDQRQDILAIERLTKSSIPISSHPQVPSEKFHASKRGKSRSKRSFSFSKRRRRH